MMYEVKNMPKSISYKLLDSVIVFACDFLSMPVETDLEIEFDSTLNEFQCGYCDIEDDVVKLWLDPKLNVKEIVATIFHEMVHIRQMLDGDLLVGEGSVPSTWCGIAYSCEYLELPWEKEAFRLEKEMMEIYYAG